MNADIRAYNSNLTLRQDLQALPIGHSFIYRNAHNLWFMVERTNDSLLARHSGINVTHKLAVRCNTTLSGRKAWKLINAINSQYGV